MLLSVLSRHAEEAFSYGEYCGYYPLRDTLSRILSAQGIPTQAEQVLITNGSQHAISSLVVQSLLAPGDTVIVEEPTYAEALGLLRQHRINIVTVPGDRHGMRVDLLPELLERHRPKLIYTIPNFHNPTGRCLGEAAATPGDRPTGRRGDPGGRLRRRSALPGQTAAVAAALAQPGAVIYVSTFSKMLLPSMRIGYLVADSEHYQRFARLKHVDSFTSSSLIQRALDAFVTVGRYDKQLRRAGRVYRRHLEVMIDILQRRLPPGCRFRNAAGLVYLAALPAAVTHRRTDAGRLAARRDLRTRRMLFMRAGTAGAHGLRLNFAANSPPQIEEGRPAVPGD